MALVGDKINARRVLVRKPEGKRPLGRPRRRYEEVILNWVLKRYDVRAWIRIILLRIVTDNGAHTDTQMHLHVT